MDLLVTPEEDIMMRKDYDAANEAGIDINNVKWYSKDEVEKVSPI